MKHSVYIETSVISYLTSKPSRNLIIAAQQEITREWWEVAEKRFDMYVSELVIEEAKKGDSTAAQKRLNACFNLSILSADEESGRLAKVFLKESALPEKASADALHIAIATVNGINYLTSWNCTHIANATIQKLLMRIAAQEGYELPIICTPSELIEGE
jgi:predicted nucleic acid-binding protein